ncbi:F-box/LRR-repeat protein At4g14103-like [Bidens hawaiensis]|uniref:F-box/LRR-repeat protein At4g14103-like n=1 Tax=Bidens hawaiensis TaxID=980011 RepID=UPI004049C620
MSSISENVHDRISRLPDEIIAQILTLMPTKYAVRTSVLSKRWRYTWVLVKNLDFDDIHPIHGEEILTEFVDRVLKLCKTSRLNLFRLHFSKIRVKNSSVSSWINEAVKLNVNELDIQVINLGLPFSMFTCKTLTSLRLYGDADVRYDWEFPCRVNLPCLKTLDVAVYSDPCVGAFKLISGCPILENISLKVILRPKDDDDYLFNIPTLKRLNVTWPNDPYTINKVVLNVPNLEYLFVGGVLCSKFVMEDVSSLVEASVSIHRIRNCHVWVELFKGLSGVKSLSVQNLSSLIDFKTSVSFNWPVFPSMKHLALNGRWLSRPILRFLESCPVLKHLCIERVVQPFPEEDSCVVPVPACILTNLTIINISICNGTKPEMEFLEYMLGNAKVLKLVTITWENLCVEKERQLCEKLAELPRASRFFEISFHGASGARVAKVATWSLTDRSK